MRGTSGHMVELVIGVDSKSILFKNQFSNFENCKKELKVEIII